jgi:hypothetical protein
MGGRLFPQRAKRPLVPAGGAAEAERRPPGTCQAAPRLSRALSQGLMTRPAPATRPRCRAGLGGLRRRCRASVVTRIEDVPHLPRLWRTRNMRPTENFRPQTKNYFFEKSKQGRKRFPNAARAARPLARRSKTLPPGKLLRAIAEPAKGRGVRHRVRQRLGHRPASAIAQAGLARAMSRAQEDERVLPVVSYATDRGGG